MDDNARACLNCGTPLHGAFCHHCGQKDQPRRVRLGHLLEELVGAFLNYDQKVLSSLWLLVSRPGFLAQEYLEGRRVRHLSPLRIYVVISFVMFFLFSFVPAGQKRQGGTKPAQVELHLEGVEASGEARPKGSHKPSWASALQARAKRAQADPDHFKATFLNNLSRALFLLMPFFALLLFLLHLRSRTFFVEHMVLSLHYHAFSFLIILALLGLALLPGEDWGCWPGAVLFFTPPVYLTLALQRLYRRGWVRSALKAALASTIYGIALTAALLGLLYLSLPDAGPGEAAPAVAEAAAP